LEAPLRRRSGPERPRTQRRANQREPGDERPPPSGPLGRAEPADAGGARERYGDRHFQPRQLEDAHGASPILITSVNSSPRSRSSRRRALWPDIHSAERRSTVSHQRNRRTNGVTTSRSNIASKYPRSSASR